MHTVKVMSFLINAGSGLGFSFGARPWTEMEIWCVKRMFILKVEKNLGFNVGLKRILVFSIRLC